MLSRSWKANQKLCKERPGTRLGRDVDLVSQKSHVMANGVILHGSHETFLGFRVLVLLK